LGAVLGAAVFDIVGSVVASAVIAAKGIPPNQQAEVGGTSRVLYAIALGAGIALFIGIVRTWRRAPGCVSSLAENEGREWPLYNAHTVIGRSETASIPIFGDPTLQPLHATISNLGAGQYSITAGEGPVLVNGQPVASGPLPSGSHSDG